MYREELPLMENFGMIVWLIDASAAVYTPLIAYTHFVFTLRTMQNVF
jgi:hypothetical protein